jgi:hypothetical protein
MVVHILNKMAEKKHSATPESEDFFNSNVSFDIEYPAPKKRPRRRAKDGIQPTRRRKPNDSDPTATEQQKSASNRSDSEQESKNSEEQRGRATDGAEKTLIEGNQAEPEEQAHSNCPGCGSAIPQSEFLYCLASFVIGADDHMGNNPTRALPIQTLRNEVSNLPLPHPHEAWELEVLHRIENQFQILLEAELRRARIQLEQRLEEEIRLKILTEIQATSKQT